jgi:hypothetical protein
MAKPSEEHAMTNIIEFPKQISDSRSLVEKLDFILKYGDATTKETLTEYVDFAYSVVCQELLAKSR